MYCNLLSFWTDKFGQTLYTQGLLFAGLSVLWGKAKLFKFNDNYSNLFVCLIFFLVLFIFIHGIIA